MLWDNGVDPGEDAVRAIDADIDDLPDPWEGVHDIEYWVWNGTRLVPASEEGVQSIREQERTRDALWRLEQWNADERRAARNLRMRTALERITRLLPRRAPRLPRRPTQAPASGTAPMTQPPSTRHAEA